MKKRIAITSLVATAILAVTLYAQARGTPATLRVMVDANGALLTATTAQVNPVTTVVFNNARLAVDASGNLLTVASGGAGSGTVTNIATTSPITGGAITTTGTIACATCGVTGTGLSQFASTTSAQLATLLSDETGTAGVAVFSITPTFGTSIIDPLVIGGTTASSTLTLQSTSGVGTTDQVLIKNGNAGAIQSAAFTSTGLIELGSLPCAASGCTVAPAFGIHFTPPGNTNFVADVFNASNAGFSFIGRHARGDKTTPTATQANDVLFAMLGRGWEGNTPAWATANNAVIQAQANEAFTNAAQGSKLIFQVVPNSSVTTGTALTITGSGLVTSLVGSAMAVANVGANSCGTTTATIAGNQTVGEVTVGATSGTQCRVAVPQATTTRFNGSCNNQTTANICRLVAVDTTHFDLVGTFVAGDVVAYFVASR